VQNALHARIYFIPKVGSVKTFVTRGRASRGRRVELAVRRHVPADDLEPLRLHVQLRDLHDGHLPGKARVAFRPTLHVVVTAATCVTPEQGETTRKKYPLRKG
jgi:hypothetical protein